MTNSYLIKWKVTVLQFETSLNVTQYTAVKGSLNVTIWTDPNVGNLSHHSEVRLPLSHYINSQNSQPLTLGISFNLINISVLRYMHPRYCNLECRIFGILEDLWGILRNSQELLQSIRIFYHFVRSHMIL